MSGEKCRACDGTGLYAGIFETRGTAVVCRNCKGKGGTGGFQRVRGRAGGSMAKANSDIETVQLSYREWDELMRSAGR